MPCASISARTLAASAPVRMASMRSSKGLIAAMPRASRLASSIHDV